MPRILPADERQGLEAGLRQRVRALNACVANVYNRHEIPRAGVVPAELILCNAQYRPAMQRIDVPGGIYAHIAGIDVVRADDGRFHVLEDNLRVPSGVSYTPENRKMMMRLFPGLFARHSVAPVEHYPDVLLENRRSDAAPVRGVRSGGGGEALHVAVVVAASAPQQQQPVAHGAPDA